MEDRFGRNMVVEKEFGAEMAGERVGWVAMTPRGDRGAQNIHLVATTISAGGALIQHELRDEDSGQRKVTGWHDAIQGFESTAALTMLVQPGEEIAEQVQMRKVRWTLGDNRANAISMAAEGHNDSEALESSREWFNSANPLLPRLREMMAEKDMEQFFPLVYYTANMLVAHKTFPQQRLEAVTERQPERLLMPMEGMAEQTTEQIEVTQDIVAAFDAQIAGNQVMQKNLTAFGYVPAPEIPDAFESSRRAAAQQEAAIAIARGKLLTYMGVYLPVGYRREWPYMDASCEDEEKAYGVELDRLQSGGTLRAERGLRLELFELEVRRTFAQNGLNVLRLLSAAESA